jgi:hypothetical protein
MNGFKLQQVMFLVCGWQEKYLHWKEENSGDILR